MIPSAARTRVLLMEGPDELLRAVLPPPSQLHYERAAITFLESLALWLNTNVHVVLSVDEKEVGCCLGLTDELGVGVRSLYFDVEVRDRRARRRRGQRARRTLAMAKEKPFPRVAVAERSRRLRRGARTRELWLSSVAAAAQLAAAVVVELDPGRLY
jgi:hypothetical protein